MVIIVYGEYIVYSVPSGVDGSSSFPILWLPMESTRWPSSCRERNVFIAGYDVVRLFG
jgi:hypothetical protein